MLRKTLPLTNRKHCLNNIIQEPGIKKYLLKKIKKIKKLSKLKVVTCEFKFSYYFYFNNSKQYSILEYC